MQAIEPAHLDKLRKHNHTLYGGILRGLDGYVVEIQGRAMDVLKGPVSWRSAAKISGMGKGAIREAMDRISGAFAKFDVPDPQVSILINLYPADLLKEGTWLDLPIAIVLLQAAGFLPALDDHLKGDYVLFGELGIHGEVRPVPGALSIAYCAKSGQTLIVPAGNEMECALVKLARSDSEKIRVCGVSELDQLIGFFAGQRPLEPALRKHGNIQFQSVVPKAPDFGVIRGQVHAKEATYIAAAGGHNLLLIGPPGEGKSLLASAMPGVLPRLTDQEKVELTKIYSAHGELGRDGVAVTRRPFRPIHHTVTKQALVGGGSKFPTPGEITLAHLGVLFLDEIAEFSAATLNALRQPIESGEVTISRVGGTLTYPSRFTLLAAMNPCPCGWYGTERCSCKPTDVNRYQRRISGPIVDRIDLQVEMKQVSHDERFAEAQKGLSDTFRAKVEAARQMQLKRFVGTDIPFNAAIPGGHVREHCDFSGTGLQTYKEIIAGNTLSTRSMDRLAKVARTVADLCADAQVEPHHVQKAMKFVIGGPLRK